MLFYRILKAVAGSPNAPSLIHSQCTTQQGEGPGGSGGARLPTAKFDLMVNHKPDTTAGHADSMLLMLLCNI